MRCTKGVGAAGWALAAVLWLPAGPVAAQESEAVSAQEMAAFAAAAREIQVMRSKARRPVARAVRERMKALVREQGLTLERYNGIATRVRKETGLYARYQEAWRDLGG